MRVRHSRRTVQFEVGGGGLFVSGAWREMAVSVGRLVDCKWSFDLILVLDKSTRPTKVRRSRTSPQISETVRGREVDLGSDQAGVLSLLSSLTPFSASVELVVSSSSCCCSL